jgi:GH35 family endo-1,4-beta-xylanase
VYDGTDIAGIEPIVERVEKAEEPWRAEARRRIERHRKADATITVTDASGRPLRGAEVRVVLRRHGFRFGGAISARAFSGQAKGVTAEQYKALVLRFFNYVGFCNALKYKLRGGLEPLVPPIMEWMAAHRIPVRGHTLIWPGWSHMHRDALKFKDDPAGLKTFCRRQIIEYARKWDVVEWDVINESRGNHAIQDILGKDIMVEWFKLAEANVKNKGARLLLNENRVISTFPKQAINLERYMKEVQFLIDHGAPVSGLGFQSRFKFDCPPEEIYRRLCLFERFKLPIAATEFELANTGHKKWTDEERAVMTERIMTVYFSHPLVSSIVAWTFLDAPDPEDPRGLLSANLHPKLNGKMWLYLTRRRWHTDERVSTDDRGRAQVRGFLGEYGLEVRHRGARTSRRFELAAGGARLTVAMD